MSTRRTNVAELDDAAFRARLAPLAQAVLPAGAGQGSAARRQPGLRVALRLTPVPEMALPDIGAQPAAHLPDPDRSVPHRPRLVLAGTAVAAALLIAGGVYVTRPSFVLRDHIVPHMAPVMHETSAPTAPFAALAPSMRDAQAAPPAAVAPTQHDAPTGALPSAAAVPSMRDAHPARPAAVAPPQPDAPAGALSSAAAAASAHDAPVNTAPSAAAAPTDDMVTVLLRRGDAALGTGDITAARLLFERAAAQGSAVAALAAAKAYDIAFLLQIGARGSQADPDKAAAWYRKAAALGDLAARERLRNLEGQRPP